MYGILKILIKVSLYAYYRRISVRHAINPSTKATNLYLSNHQNALMDVLLLATHSTEPLHFMARADIFKVKVLQPFFRFLKMIPVYRVRDGIRSVRNNYHTFERAGKLLAGGHSVALFPEANHSLVRKVRPLSKGFTRILEQAMAQNAKSEIMIIPVGQNYQQPTHIADSAGLCFGKPIPLSDYSGVSEWQKKLTHDVSMELKKLTTHIPDYLNYEETIKNYEEKNYDLSLPVQESDKGKHPERLVHYIPRFFFLMWNAPLWLLWNYGLKPRVPEPEFVDTFRFCFALISHSISYMLFMKFIPLDMAVPIVIIHFLGNIFMLKMGIK